ncbi:glycine dehydrogenase subunit 2 [Sulfodiicoccus acidiphilus]|uniref:glycine dehydrogenase (aminomethyl-transferring) n=1 Tax=Sulfodiicoccus acidiphilus TaxID=1670455 RepID=A0A348B3H1_9CREN|nr:aminomethyl-transferring glycine dehydrogenase subunit GcvPB [Sulfodiicoccus acidiphilus]BBD72723.1 glycine dehydrogenase subunit 2 [Sulfodiicoccus acidiphilus]GGT95287.1 glycine dehydrogenase subunit 2 [Sulfodiicoccus acidiphilus]
MWNQARWEEPLLFQYKGKNRVGLAVPREDVNDRVEVPSSVKRRNPLELPELSELEVVRHFIRLSQMSYGVDVGMVPLGSCTMKYNPKVQEAASKLTENAHPLQDEDTVQGVLEMLYDMQNWLAEITGMEQCSLQVPAGSAGELAGVLMMKKYHEDKGETRTDMLVADSAHGTNPASAAMAGFKVVYVKTDHRGLVDYGLLKEIVGPSTAGFMLTNPNTLGLFEENILEIADTIHSVDGKLYYDGANLNGIVGVARPGDMGFDIVHLNLHKTFAVPHGGGGPGAGAICAKGDMVDYLPGPLVGRVDGSYSWSMEPHRSIGRIATFHGNVGNVVRSFAYLLGLGSDGVNMLGVMSTLATNYLMSRLQDVRGLQLPFPGRPRKHEVVYSVTPAYNEIGLTAEDVAKGLLDRGFYAPTIYFPPIVQESLMIEVTETEPKESIDEFARALYDVMREAYSDLKAVKQSPKRTSVSRLDYVKANHPSTFTPTFRVKRLREEGSLQVLK